jgi:GH35 family endo-1,4-beta-xylanase
MKLFDIVLKNFLSSACICLVGLSASPLSAQTGQIPPGQRLLDLAATNDMLVGCMLQSGFTTNYQQVANREFNLYSPENAFKWADAESKSNYFSSNTWATNFLAAIPTNDLVLGDVLVYYTGLPGWITNSGVTWTSNSLYTVMTNHIRGVMLQNPTVQIWEVVDEAFDSPTRQTSNNTNYWTNGNFRTNVTGTDVDIFNNNIGHRYVEDAFIEAHTVNSNAILLYNDDHGEELNTKATNIFKMVTDFQNRNIPIDAVGFECHFFTNPEPNYASIRQNFDWFSTNTGLQLYVTEVDCPVSNTPTAFDVQARVYYNLVDAVFRSPMTRSFQCWGVSDSHSWLNTTNGTNYPLPFDTNFNAKPAYYAIQDGLAYPDRNEVVANTGFEAGTNGWYANDTNSTLSIVAGGHSGSNAVYVADRKENWGGPCQNITRSVQTTGAGRYYLSGWLRVDQSALPPGSNSIPAQLMVKVSDGPTANPVWTYYQVGGNITTNWTCLSGFINLTWFTNLSSITLYSETPATGYTSNYYADDITLSDGNLLTNGNFETGTLSDWIEWGTCGISISTNSYLHHYGLTACAVTNRLNNIAGVAQEITTNLLASGPGSYYFQSYMKLGAGTTDLGTMAVQLTYGTNIEYVWITGPINSTNWTKVSGSNTLNWNGPLTSAYLYMDTQTYGNNLYVDDALLQLQTQQTPEAPTNLTADASGTSVNLNWTNISGVDRYSISRSTNDVSYSVIATTTNASYTDGGSLLYGITYYYYVNAINYVGSSPNSSVVSALTEPAAPTGLTAVPGSDEVYLNWIDSPGATTYTVYSSLNSSGTYGQLVILGAGSTNYTDTNASNGFTYYYKVQAGNSGGASTSGYVAATPPLGASGYIGVAGLPGSLTASNGTYVLSGAGTNVYSTADNFYFAYSPWVGDVALVTYVSNLTDTSEYAKAGIMIRESLSTNSQMADADVTPGYGIEFIRRYAVGGVSTNTVVTNLTAPYWLMLQRTANVISSYRSADGINWELSGSDTVDMTPEVYVGLMVCSQTSSEVCTATFTNFTMGEVWNGTNIGSTGGNWTLNPLTDVFTNTGSGTDMSGSSDECQFTYTLFPTNGQVSALVQSVSDTYPWAKAGVMIRDGFATNSAQATVNVTPVNGVQFIYRTNDGGLDLHSGASGINPPCWVQLIRTNMSNYIANYSLDGTNWINLGTNTITMDNPVSAGMVVCSVTNGVLCTGVFSNVTVHPNP